MKRFYNFLALIIFINFNSSSCFSMKKHSTYKTKSTATTNQQKQSQNTNTKTSNANLINNGNIPQVVEVKADGQNLVEVSDANQKQGNIITNNPKAAAATGVVSLSILVYFGKDLFGDKKPQKGQETEEEKKLQKIEEQFGITNEAEKIKFVLENLKEIDSLCKKSKDLFEINLAHNSSHSNSRIQKIANDFTFIILDEKSGQNTIKVVERANKYFVALTSKQEGKNNSTHELEISEIYKELNKFIKEEKIEEINKRIETKEQEMNKIDEELQQLISKEKTPEVLSDQLSKLNSKKKRKNIKLTIDNTKQQQVQLRPEIKSLEDRIEKIKEDIDKEREKIKTKPDQKIVVNNLYQILIRMFAILSDEWSVRSENQMHQIKTLKKIGNQEELFNKLLQPQGDIKEELCIHMETAQNTEIDLSFIPELHFAEYQTVPNTSTNEEMEYQESRDNTNNISKTIPANHYQMSLVANKNNVATFRMQVRQNPTLTALLKNDKQVHQVYCDILYAEDGFSIQIYEEKEIIFHKKYQLKTMMEIFTEKNIDFKKEKETYDFIQKFDSFIGKQIEEINEECKKKEEDRKSYNLETNKKKLTSILILLIQNFKAIKDYDGFHGFLEIDRLGCLNSDFKIVKEANGHLIYLSNYPFIALGNANLWHKNKFKTLFDLSSRFVIYMEEESNKMQIKIDYQTFEFENEGKSLKIHENINLFDEKLTATEAQKFDFNPKYKERLEATNYSPQLFIADKFIDSINFDYAKEREMNSQITEAKDKTCHLIEQIKDLVNFINMHMRIARVPMDKSNKEIYQVKINSDNKIFQFNGVWGLSLIMQFNNDYTFHFMEEQSPHCRLCTIKLSRFDLNKGKDKISIIKDQAVHLDLRTLSPEEQSAINKAIHGITTAIIKNDSHAETQMIRSFIHRQHKIDISYTGE